MQNLIIEKTTSTPYINFDMEKGILQIKGESYPENVVNFYSNVVDWIKEYLKIANNKIVLEFEIVYFNSSTSKIFLNILELLEKCYESGKDIIVKWICDKENETAIECGEEFMEDLTSLPFTIEKF